MHRSTSRGQYRISHSERESSSLLSHILLHLTRSVYMPSTPHLVP